MKSSILVFTNLSSGSKNSDSSRHLSYWKVEIPSPQGHAIDDAPGHDSGGRSSIATAMSYFVLFSWIRKDIHDVALEGPVERDSVSIP
jgi:hypothetical protein